MRDNVSSYHGNTLTNQKRVPLSTGKMDFSLTPPLKKNLHLAKDKRQRQDRSRDQNVTVRRIEAVYFRGFCRDLYATVRTVTTTTH